MSAPDGWVDADVAREYGLTPRQVQMLVGIAEGLGSAEIGARLFISVDTAKTHLRRLYGLLGVHCRAAAVARAYDVGIFRTAAARAERVVL